MIEKVIRDYITQDTFIIENLAEYDGSPAFFYIEAADDKDNSWENAKELFPRADFVIDWTADHERGVSGSLAIEVWCRNDGSVFPEDFIEPIKSRISNVFFSDTSGMYCTVWNRNYFIDPSGAEPQVSGVSMAFDIMAFPVHNLESPDPVQSIQKFISDNFSSIKVVGYSTIATVFVPTDSAPVAYIRMISETSAKPSSYAVSWRRATLGIHLFCGSITTRSKLVENISRKIVDTGWSVMNDSSPMRFISESVTINADPLRAGQISLTSEYGVLHTETSSATMSNISIQRSTT